MHPSTFAKVRDQAQGPSNFKSQPSERLKCSTLWIGAQLNLTRDHEEKNTTPKVMNLPGLHHDCTVKCLNVHEYRTLLGKAEKWWSQAQRQVVEPIDNRRLSPERWPACCVCVLSVSAWMCMSVVYCDVIIYYMIESAYVYTNIYIYNMYNPSFKKCRCMCMSGYAPFQTIST